MADVLICLKNISHAYEKGRIQALKNINLQIYKGEFVTILGASGSGKTTLLNIITGLDHPSQGYVIIDGVRARTRAQWSLLRLQRIGLIFQTFNLLPTLTALENVQVPMFGTGLNSTARKIRAKHLLDRVGLKDRTNHLPAELSGGERQRVAVARCLANDPILILADEPTGSLDSVNSAAVMDLLNRLRVEEQTTTVMVTHDAHLARRGDRCIEIVDGVIHRQVDLDEGQSCAS